MSSQFIDLAPPASALIQSLRSIGYDLKSAVADIIDNSIAADSTFIDIYIKQNKESNTIVTIMDNGNGMDSKELQRALTLGSHNPLNKRSEEDLGRFGMGLKTASFSQCKQLTVVSKINHTIHAGKWDLDHVTSTNRWELLWLDDENIHSLLESLDLSFDNNGTLVIWEECDNIHSENIDSSIKLNLLAEESKKLYEHLGLVFHKFLDKSATSFEMNLNGRKIIAKDPFATSKKNKEICSIRPYNNIHLIQDEQVEVKGYLLPHPSKLNTEQMFSISPDGDYFNAQGFYIYRANRLIVWGDWFRLLKKTQSNKIARVEVNIPNTLDSVWRLDIKKAKVELPKELRTMLRASIEQMGFKSQRVFHKRVMHQRPNSTALWIRQLNNENKSVQYVIDRKHPLIEEMIDSLTDTDTAKITSLLKIIELLLPTDYISNDIASSYIICPKLDDSQKEEIIQTIQALESINLSSEMIIEQFSNADGSSKEITDFVIHSLQSRD